MVSSFSFVFTIKTVALALQTVHLRDLLKQFVKTSMELGIITALALHLARRINPKHSEALKLTVVR